MELRPLGRSGIEVSALCLGTMTWGTQNSEKDAHAQIDMARDHGVNFIDTAELYPVPRSRQTQGMTESYIGSWLATHGGRDQWVLASKVVGPMGPGEKWFRGGDNRFDRKHMTQALEDSLRRCQTDYFDLYQLHWPERDVQVFGRHGSTFNREINWSWTPFEEVLGILQDFIQEGKVRAVGLSNETAWGCMRYLGAHTAAPDSLPRMASIQNSYSLLNRSFEGDLAEIAMYENCGLLAYSTLAMGLLTGKYRHGAVPEGSRLSVWRNPRYWDQPMMEPAVEAYIQLAETRGLDPTHMALAFVTQRPFVTSNIIGATTLAQLAHNFQSLAITLDADTQRELDAIHQRYPNPCP